MMRIGYIVLAHQKPKQLERLLKRLEDDSVKIFVHIDKRTDIEAFLPSFNGIKNLQLLKRFPCHWGNFGIVNATMEGIKAAIASDCEYIAFLSGADYPIKTKSEINHFLNANNGANFLHHYKMPADYWIPDKEINRIKKYYYNFNNKLFEYPLPIGTKSIPRNIINLVLSLFLPKERKFPNGIVPYGGDYWCCLTSEALREVVHFYEKNPLVFKFLKYCLFPDEILIQTALFNSGNKELISSIVNDSITEINWESRIDPSPKIYSINDFDRLANSGKMFARKFDHDQHPALAEKIDSELLNKNPSRF
jgi:hypothetical protein